MNYRKCENCNSDEIFLNHITNEFVCAKCAVVQTELNILNKNYEEDKRDEKNNRGSYFVANTIKEKKLSKLNSHIYIIEKKRLENIENIFNELNKEFMFNDESKSEILKIERELRRYINKMTHYRTSLIVAIIYFSAKRQLFTQREIFKKLKIKKKAKYLKVIEMTSRKMNYRQDKVAKCQILIERFLTSVNDFNRTRSEVYQILKCLIENKKLRESEIAELIYETLRKNNITISREKIAKIFNFHQSTLQAHKNF